MLQTIIIDDNQANINTLHQMIEMYCPQISIGATAQNIEEAYSSIMDLQPSLVFLDIEMPHGNGFDLLKKFEQISFEVIFTTAYDQYAVEAFRENALDYLLKPINIDALQQAVKKAEQKANLLRTNDYFERLIQGLQANARNKISIPVMDGLLFINAEDIIRCEGSGSYSHFCMKNGKKLTASLRLKECEALLPPHLFFRVHHSHIINLNYIVRYFKGRGGYILMEDNSSVELASRKKDAFLAFLKQR